MTIAELSNAVANLAGELRKLEAERATIEGQAVRQILDAAKGGLKWERLWSEHTNSTRNHNEHNEWMRDDKGNVLKGIELYNLDNRGYTPNDLTMSITIDDDDVWLLSDGRIALVNVQGVRRRYENSRDTLTAKIERFLEPEQLDAERVAAAIQKHLTARLKNLGDRTQEQQRRIGRLQAMLNAKP